MTWSQRALRRLIRSSIILIDLYLQDGRVVNVGGLAVPISDTLTTWKALVRAPSGTDFESELFTIELTILSAMTMVPRQVRLIGYIPSHPSIHPTTGVVAMDILEHEYWSPAIRLSTTLLCVRVLLGAPNLDNFCFEHAYNTNIKTAITTRRICHCTYGTCYLWLWKQEHFNSLPLELWFNCVSYLLPESTARSMAELALEANIQNETLTAACTAEEVRHAKFVSIARELYARDIPTD